VGGVGFHLQDCGGELDCVFVLAWLGKNYEVRIMNNAKYIAKLLARRFEHLFGICFVAAIVQVMGELRAKPRILFYKIQFRQRPKISGYGGYDGNINNVFNYLKHVCFGCCYVYM